jgi:outer membrane receptor protein involved in Fe transport
MNRVAGVWVNVTGGEGHMTAIRQPKTTSPVYLFAEDGVPTRSTGFFNHNALYEVSLPQADRIEVLKGPMSALYGSDAIGGVVNVVTRAPAEETGASVALEGGAWGFARALAAATIAGERDAVRAELNVTRTDGWRDGTAYDRESAVVRWDRQLAGASLRTVATFSRIDQGTAGSSAITRDDYLDTPVLNYTPISWRRVHAFRLYAAWDRPAGDALLSLTPFVRWNRMEMLPNWTLTYDPSIVETGHASAGVLLKYRRELAPLRARVIAGADVDFSPGRHFERTIVPARDGRIFTSYADGEPIYDYDVRFSGISPWLQLEASPVERLRLVAGLRFDHVGYVYDNALGELATGPHRRPASARVTYDRLSPKLGATLALAPALGLYAAYGHGFRAPSEGQLFRQGRAQNTIGLSPIAADNVEAGVRGTIAGRIAYELAAYRMTKRDDILALTNADGSTENVNAGETLHRGVELTAGADLGERLRLDASYSRARHSYESWQPRADLSFDGNEMEDAPRDLVTVIAAWRPALLGEDGGLSIEWQHVGPYWMDPANTHRYAGHDLLHARLGVRVSGRALLYGRLMNATDARYAESAAFTAARGEEFAPGLPRALYVGLEVR